MYFKSEIKEHRYEQDKRKVMEIQNINKFIGRLNLVWFLLVLVCLCAFIMLAVKLELEINTHVRNAYRMKIVYIEHARNP